MLDDISGPITLNLEPSLEIWWNFPDLSDAESCCTHSLFR